MFFLTNFCCIVLGFVPQQNPFNSFLEQWVFPPFQPSLFSITWHSATAVAYKSNKISEIRSPPFTGKQTLLSILLGPSPLSLFPESKTSRTLTTQLFWKLWYIVTRKPEEFIPMVNTQLDSHLPLVLHLELPSGVQAALWKAVGKAAKWGDLTWLPLSAKCPEGFRTPQFHSSTAVE